MTLTDRRIAFIGGGRITEIIVSNLVKTDKIKSSRLIVSDPVTAKLETLREKYGILIADDNLEALQAADFIFINVLPQVVEEVLSEFQQQSFPQNKLIITIAAGIPLKAYEVLGEHIPAVRALPNPPSQIGKGIAAITFNPHVNDDQKEDILELFTFLGDTVVTKEENINTVMALSSPAMIYQFFQSLIDAGVREGMDRETSTRIAYQTITGAMAVWQERKIAPHELVSEASTPGGISVESLFTLEKYAFKAAIMEAIHSSVEKAKELGRQKQ